MRWYDEIKTQWIDDSEVYIVNGKMVDDETLWGGYSGLLVRAGYWLQAFRPPGEPVDFCPYCNTTLSELCCYYHEPSYLSPVARLGFCPACCCWELYREEPSEYWLDGDDTAPVSFHMGISKLAEFPASLPIGCEQNLLNGFDDTQAIGAIYLLVALRSLLLQYLERIMPIVKWFTWVGPMMAGLTFCLLTLQRPVGCCRSSGATTWMRRKVWRHSAICLERWC